MIAATRLVLLVLQLQPAGVLASTHSLEGSLEGTQSVQHLRGLSLDLEACFNGACLLASAQDAVYLMPGEAGPVRIRLHLDCAEAAEVRGIARRTRVILVRADTSTLECPRYPLNAHCMFRFWEDESRWKDEIVADFTPWSADTSWPDADGRVDEAEIVLELPGYIPPGEYELVAALPKELVDEYPCTNVREHLWVESPPLRVVSTDQHERLAWEAEIHSLLRARQLEDIEGVGLAIDRMRRLAREAPQGALPPPQVVESAFVAACPWLDGPECLAVRAGMPATEVLVEVPPPQRDARVAAGAFLYALQRGGKLPDHGNDQGEE